MEEKAGKCEKGERNGWIGNEHKTEERKAPIEKVDMGAARVEKRTGIKKRGQKIGIWGNGKTEKRKI